MSELELTGTNDQLELRELVRFFSVLSHDLKSPIFSIDGFSDLLLSDYGEKLDDEGRDFLQRVRSAAQQMRRVLDEMTHMVKLLSRPNSLQSDFDERARRRAPIEIQLSHRRGRCRLSRSFRPSGRSCRP